MADETTRVIDWPPELDTRVYFAVPDHYTIGAEFKEFAAAVVAAQMAIRELDFGGHSRAFVDVRIKDKTGDRPIARFEIFHDNRVEQMAVST